MSYELGVTSYELGVLSCELSERVVCEAGATAILAVLN